MNIKAIVAFGVVSLGILLGATALLWNVGEQKGKPIEQVAGDGRHTKGEGSVTVVEFSDQQCPACRSVHTPLMQILSKYEGRAKFVYRHFPLTNLHKNALVASYATEAADMQGKFWEMSDKLFTAQDEWQGLGAEEAKQKFEEYAKDLQMNGEKFVKDIDSQEAKEAVARDTADATKFGIAATPTFFVNGVETPFNKLETTIESKLSQ